MKRISSIFFVITLFFASFAFAQTNELKVGVVNVNDLFNESNYIKTAGDKLQNRVKEMETKVQDQQQKVQDLAAKYDEAQDKESLRLQIVDEQNKLTQMTQDFQQQIKDEQNQSIQSFSDNVRQAVEKVAAKHNLTAVFSNNALIWNDPNWIDITNEVKSELNQPVTPVTPVQP